MNDIRVDLTPLVRQVNDMARQLSSQMSDVDYKVTSVADDVNMTRDDLKDLRGDLKDLRDEFDAFVRTHERTRLLQLAETRLGTLKSDLEREYGHYGVVRRTSVGILQAFDVGNVRTKTVHEISEELMIQTPRYWLAPALVALAAWTKDDQSLAEKSVEAAFSRDSKKTSLLFALVLRRQARLEDATRWLRHYFASLDPRALTREFAVLLEAVAQDGFGADGRQLVLEHLEQWREILRDEPGIVAAQVQKWRGEMLNHRGAVDDATYPALAARSPQWGQAKAVLEHASAHQFVLDKYTAVRDTPTLLTASVADRLDDLLELLVEGFDTDELPLRREVIYQEAIIEHDGDADRAQAQADLDVAALDETIDALSLQTHTAFRPDLFGVSPSTQRLSVGACADDFSTAVSQHSLEYRTHWQEDVDLVLGNDHSTMASTYGFGEWKTSTATPQAEAEQSLSMHWNKVVQKYIDANTFSVSKVIPQILVGVAGLVIGGVMIGGGSAGVGLVIAIAALAIAGFLILQKKQKSDAAVAQAKVSRDKAKAVSIDLYREASAEWVDVKLVYEEEDVKEADLLALVDGWPT